MSRAWLYCVMLLAATSGEAAQLDVQVLDRTGRPVEDLVVTLRAPVADRPALAAQATMDQIDQRFVPFVLPVRTGTAVVFPNSDSVAHQVYSFSPAKRFELGLYRGRPHAPIVFDTPGVIVLGCNIHDRMIGYIYVTDAAELGKTDAQGAWTTRSLAAGEYRLEVWSPLFARDEPKPVQTVKLDDAAPAKVVVRLSRSLRAAPQPQADRNVRDY